MNSIINEFKNTQGAHLNIHFREGKPVGASFFDAEQEEYYTLHYDRDERATVTYFKFDYARDVQDFVEKFVGRRTLEKLQSLRRAPYENAATNRWNKNPMKEGTFTIQFTNDLKDGVVGTVHDTWFNYLTRDGEPYEHVVLLRDNTPNTFFRMEEKAKKVVLTEKE